MQAADLERKYLPLLQRRCGLVLLPAQAAIQLLEDAESSNVRLLGVEGFRILEDGGIQPTLEFSNISYGRAEKIGDKVRFEPELRPRTPWDSDPKLLSNTRSLISDGVAHGYEWYEISLEDIENGDLLFFRRDA